MNYRLVVLTHGDSEPLARTMESFERHVTPPPTSRSLIVDGPIPGWNRMVHPSFDPSDETTYSDVKGGEGFCEATRCAWMFNSHPAVESPLPDLDYVFWLEHDFRFTRDVDLRDLAHVLDRRSDLAQMALMRDPVNAAERAAGGLYELRRDSYQFVSEFLPGPSGANVDWLEHGSYFTTNPSLMRRDFMAENPWPDYPSECEGRFGLDLVARGYRFGAWGTGEPWVTHIGERTGHGY